jgi:hypothetical protein
MVKADKGGKAPAISILLIPSACQSRSIAQAINREGANKANLCSNRRWISDKNQLVQVPHVVT